MLSDCSKARGGAWRRSWKISSSIWNKWEGQRGQNQTVLTPGYQSALTSEEGRNFYPFSFCVKAPVACRHKPTAVPGVLWGMVQPAWGKGDALSKCEADLKERQITRKRRKEKKSKSRILPKQIAFLPKKGIAEKAPAGLIVALRQSSLLGKVAALFPLPGSDELCPQPGRRELPPGCLGAGDALLIAALFRGREHAAASFASCLQVSPAVSFLAVGPCKVWLRYHSSLGYSCLQFGSCQWALVQG